MLLPFTINPTPAEGDPPSSSPLTPRTDEPFLISFASGMRPPPPDRDEQLRAVFEASPLAIVSLDFEGRVTLWNPAAEALFGWTADEAIGRTPSPELVTLAKNAIAGDTVTGVEATHTRKDGGRVKARVSIAPLRGAGAAIGTVAIFTREPLDDEPPASTKRNVP
jgi:PAS domain S-box-containing protein